MMNLLSLRAVRAFALAAVTAGLAGCASPPTNIEFAEMTFRHLPQIQLLANDLTVESRMLSPSAGQNVAHQFPTPPETALRNWARDRLVARGAGTSGATATFTIIRAEATSQPLKTDTGFTGLFKQELGNRYDARVEATLTIRDRNGRNGNVEARAQHSATVREDSTLVERRKVMYEITEKLMAEFNAEMERNIRSYLRDFVQ